MELRHAAAIAQKPRMWQISEEFAREHARKLRDLASVMLLRDQDEKAWRELPPVKHHDLESLASEFERQFAEQRETLAVALEEPVE